MISRRGQIASANRSTPRSPIRLSLVLLPFPKETRRKRFARTHARNTVWKYRGDGGVPTRLLTLLATAGFEIAVSTERKVIATAASCRGVNVRDRDRTTNYPFVSIPLQFERLRARSMRHSFFVRRQIGSDNCESRLRQSRRRSSVQLTLRDGARLRRFSSAWSITVARRECRRGRGGRIVRLRNLRGYCFRRIASRGGRKLITADDACRRVITFYWRAPD